MKLASISKQQSFGRVGLMALSECITSVGRRIRIDSDIEEERLKNVFPYDQKKNVFPHKFQVEQSTACAPSSDLTNPLDALRYVVESCKQHFNPHYRLQGPHQLLLFNNLLISYHIIRWSILRNKSSYDLYFFLMSVCDRILEAAASVVCSFSVPLQILLHFIGSFPREFTVYGGKTCEYKNLLVM